MCAPAAGRFDKFVIILLAVVVAELFAGLDISLGINENALARLGRFAVWFACVVQITTSIVSLCSVNSPLFVDIKQIAAAAAIGFLIRNDFTGVFDDKCALWDECFGIESKPCARALNLQGVRLFF